MLAIVGVVFWLWWHFKQSKIEETQMKEEIEKYGSKEKLSQIVSTEDPANP